MTTGAAEREVLAAGGAGLEAQLGLVEDTLLDAVGKTTVVTLPAPVLGGARAGDGLEALLDSGFEDGLRDGAFFFAPPGDGTAFAGLGVAERVDLADGAAKRLREVAADLLARAEHVVHPAAALAPAPRLFGGLSFDGAAPGPDDPFFAFGLASFVLPRLVVARDAAGRASLSVAAGRADPPAARRALVEEVRALFTRLVRRPNEAPSPKILRVETRPSLEGWRREIEAFVAASAPGRLEKIVAARRTTVEAAAPWDLASVLRALGRIPAAERALRFAFVRRGVAFVGLTPERLVEKTGDHLATEALAGTAAASGDVAGELASLKTAEEHAVVVRAIVRALGPHADRIEASEPELRALGHLVHLRTPISARLAPGTHVLSLVEALHPTPAVCGWPTDAARVFLRAEEGWSRGWYASPVGWFDAAGDGAFFVALRSALIEGARAHLFAGAGIVPSSVPEAEYAEVRLKETTLRRALGVEA